MKNYSLEAVELAGGVIKVFVLEDGDRIAGYWTNEEACAHIAKLEKAEAARAARNIRAKAARAAKAADAEEAKIRALCAALCA